MLTIFWSGFCKGVDMLIRVCAGILHGEVRVEDLPDLMEGKRK